MRIGIALIQQETNTFAPRGCRWEDFTVLLGEDAGDHTTGTNSEMGGAIDRVIRAGLTPVPLAYAWAMPAGAVEKKAFDRLRSVLTQQIHGAGYLDGLVLCLHGSMVAQDHPDGDAALLETAREAAGDIPLGVSLDLHANVTRRMVEVADAIVGYHTDPHVDQAATGARIANQVVGTLEGRLTPSVALAKRPMIVPAESMNTTTGPLGPIRRWADAQEGVVDISLFPVQPWLDVTELGFGVLVTTDGDPRLASDAAESVADRVWMRRKEFRIPRFMTPGDALDAAAHSDVRPFVVAEAADAPTAGAAGDSPAMVAAVLERNDELRAVIPVVDPTAAARCHEAGVGSRVDLDVGASIDDRWSDPVPFSGEVAAVGDGRYRLEGSGWTGLQVDMGRFGVVTGHGITLLLSERPAWTSDPATYRFAGIDLDEADVLVVRSCSDFRPNFPHAADTAVTLDVPGAATPRFELLEFTQVERPLWPLDHFPDDQ